MNSYPSARACPAFYVKLIRDSAIDVVEVPSYINLQNWEGPVGAGKNGAKGAGLVY